MEYLKKMVCELVPAYNKNNKVHSAKITGAHDVAVYARNIWPVDINHREAMIVLLLNRANNVVGFSTTSIGGLHATVADVKVIFQTALLANSSAIIIVHNHPSGALSPSQSDDKITSQIKKAGDILSIELLDHVIVTEEGIYSYADEGKLLN